MKKAATMFLCLAMVLVLATFAEAGVKTINSKNSEEASVSYEFVKGDNPWKIYKELFPGKISLKLVRERIIAPNVITNPRTIQIGRVITVFGKNGDLNYLLPKEKEKEPVVESEKPAENAMSPDEVYAELKRFNDELERKVKDLEEEALFLKKEKVELLKENSSLSVALATEKKKVETILVELNKYWFFIPAVTLSIFLIPLIFMIGIFVGKVREEKRKKKLVRDDEILDLIEEIKPEKKGVCHA
jgi:predicted DNA binding CopG/RHH family protein